jgi:hypothetical protein
VIDHARKSNLSEVQQQQLPESFIWVAAVFDQGGSALISAGGVVKPPKIKLALIAAGAISKLTAFAAGIGRVAIS